MSLNAFACRHEIFWIQDFSDLFGEFYFKNLTDTNTLLDDGKPQQFSDGIYYYPNMDSDKVPLLNPDPYPAGSSSYFHIGTDNWLTCNTDNVQFDGHLDFLPNQSVSNLTKDWYQFTYINPPYGAPRSFSIDGATTPEQGVCADSKQSCITGGYFPNTNDGTNLYLNIFDNTANRALNPNHVTIVSNSDKPYQIYVKKKGASGPATLVSIPVGLTTSVADEPDIVELPRNIDGSDDMGRAHVSFDRLCQLQSFDPQSQAYSNSYLGQPFVDTFPGRITNDSNSNCTIEIDNKLAWNKLNAKVTYLSDVPKNPLCAYYQISVDPADVLYDPNNTNGFFFELTTSQSTDCDDPMYKNSTSLNQHRFYPNNGVFFDPQKGTVTPLKQSITLELPKATAENPVSVSLKQRSYQIATLSQMPDHQVSSRLSTSFSLPTATSDLSPADQDLVKNCLGGTTDPSTGKVTLSHPVSIGFANPTNSFYFPNGTFATPIYVTLTRTDRSAITRDDPICGSLYDHLAFFVVDATNNNKLISNNMYSSDLPFSILPQDAVEMKNEQKDQFSGFAKYSLPQDEGGIQFSGDTKSSDRALFYLYMRQLQSSEMTAKWNIAAAYLIPGLGGNFVKSNSTISVSKSDDVKHPILQGGESDRTTATTPREFYFYDAVNVSSKMINPNMQRLDYIAGVKDASQKLIPGIFYASFGGVLSNCDDRALPSGKMPSILGGDFSILCASPMAGYMGYDPDFSENINTAQHYITKLSFNDDYFIKDIGYSSSYGYPAILRNTNRLVVFDTTGTPIRYLVQDIRRKSLDTPSDYERVHYIVNNENRTPLFLWDSATPFDLQSPIYHPLKSSVYPPLKKKQAIYLSPNSQIEFDYLVPSNEFNRNVRLVGSLSPNLNSDFTFDVSFDVYPTTMKYSDDVKKFTADFSQYDRIKLFLLTPQSMNQFNKVYEATRGGRIPKDADALDQNLIFTQIGLPMIPHTGFSIYRGLDQNHRYTGFLIK